MARIKKTTYQTIQENMEIVSVCCWLICFTCFLSHSCTKGSIFFLKEPPQPQPHNSWFCWMFPPNPAACLGFDPSQMGCGVHTAVDTVPACTSSLAIDNPRFSAPTRGPFCIFCHKSNASHCWGCPLVPQAPGASRQPSQQPSPVRPRAHRVHRVPAFGIDLPQGQGDQTVRAWRAMVQGMWLRRAAVLHRAGHLDHLRATKVTFPEGQETP